MYKKYNNDDVLEDRLQICVRYISCIDINVDTLSGHGAFTVRIVTKWRRMKLKNGNSFYHNLFITF